LDDQYTEHILFIFVAPIAPLTIALLLTRYSPVAAAIGNISSTSLAARRITFMAWRSSGATNEALVENLARHGLITQERVKKAMLGV